MNFQAMATASGFFASGNAANGYRIAVANVTGYKRVAVFAERMGATVSDRPTRFPALVKVTVPVQETCSCGCGSTQQHQEY